MKRKNRPNNLNNPNFQYEIGRRWILNYNKKSSGEYPSIRIWCNGWKYLHPSLDGFSRISLYNPCTRIHKLALFFLPRYPVFRP
jgi:hypothetical protein